MVAHIDGILGEFAWQFPYPHALQLGKAHPEPPLVLGLLFSVTFLLVSSDCSFLSPLSRHSREAALPQLPAGDQDPAVQAPYRLGQEVECRFFDLRDEVVPVVVDNPFRDVVGVELDLP